MRKPFTASMVVLVAILLANIALAQGFATPKVGVTDERLSIEQTGRTLTLYWEGWIAVVKPPEHPLTVSLRLAMVPLGRWASQPRSLRRSFPSDEVVNSFHWKVDIARMDIPEEAVSGQADLALLPYFDKGQVIKVTLQAQRTDMPSAGRTSPQEVRHTLNPLGYALLEAAHAGDYRMAEALLNKGASPDSANLLGWNALMTASAAGHRDIAQLLLDRKARVNARTKGYPLLESANGSRLPGGATALMAASYAGSPEIVRLLLDRGASYADVLGICLATGATPKDIASLVFNKQESRGEIFRSLRERGKSSDSLVQGLLDKGARPQDIERLMQRSDFALGQVVERLLREAARYEAVADLLQKHAAEFGDAVNRLREKGISESEILANLRDRGSQYTEIIALLRDAGADNTDIVGVLRQEPSEYAKTAVQLLKKRTGEVDIVRRTVDRGNSFEDIIGLLLPPDVRRSDLPELTMAQLRPQEDIVRDLLKLKVTPEDVLKFLQAQAGSVEEKRADRWTALMCAGYSGNPEVIELLLDEGASANVVDEVGYSPLALALMNGNAGAYRLLQSRGATLEVPWE
ncbi:MAG: ankyrin repeat domain-containing protein [Desulfomonile tiedjei]|nr:ankyrin repeat domain-containing protein [Desulfomonile tiedjei]